MPNQFQPWTEQEIEYLKICWSNQQSASEISGLFDGRRSRNSVLGKLHRMGVLKVKGPSRTRGFNYKPVKPDPHTPSLPVIVRQSKPKPIAPLGAPISQKLTILQLTNKTCRWPIGETNHKDFHFCGHGPQENKPYCEFHTAKAKRAA